jgi:excisionase family DNA binding protein
VSAPLLLSEQAAAVRLGVSLRTFQRLLASDDGPPTLQFGHRRLIHPADFDAWLENRRQLAVATKAKADA